MASPTEVTVFGGYFPLALRYSLDVPALFNHYGLDEIWKEEYAKIGIKHISAGSWDPCHFSMKEPITKLSDLAGKRVFTFPTAGRFLAQFGVVPVTLPWEDIEIALQTGELGWRGMVGHHRGLYRLLGETCAELPDQQYLGRLDWPLLCQYGPLE